MTGLSAKRTYLAGTGLLVMLMAVGCANPERPTPPEAKSTLPFTRHGSLEFLREGDVYGEIDVEIAETDSSRARGLMQRELLPPHSGMLFLFEREEEQSFWMANTPLALDLIFIRADSTVLRIARYVQPMSANSITSNGPAQFVLEVPAGYSDSIGLIEGDYLDWTRD